MTGRSRDPADGGSILARLSPLLPPDLSHQTLLVNTTGVSEAYIVYPQSFFLRYCFLSRLSSASYKPVNSFTALLEIAKRSRSVTM